MAGTVTLTAPETIGLGCQNVQATPGSVFRNGRLLAVRVGSPG